MPDVNHDTWNHAGVTGVPAAEAFDQTAHDAHDHTGIPGVGSGSGATFPGSITTVSVADTRSTGNTYTNYEVGFLVRKPVKITEVRKPITGASTTYSLCLGRLLLASTTTGTSPATFDLTGLPDGGLILLPGEYFWRWELASARNIRDASSDGSPISDDHIYLPIGGFYDGVFFSALQAALAIDYEAGDWG